jgi:hypothetical protein
MAKNMTRKGLALGVGAALVGSMLMAAPAQAAGELKVEPNSGARYAVTHQSLFYLNTSVTPGNNSAELAFLKYKITTGGSIAVKVANGNSKTNAAGDGVTSAVATTESADVYAADTYAAGDAVNVLEIEIESDDANTNYAVTAASKTISVVAFIDKDGDNVVDAAEWQTAATEITWVDSDLVDLVTVLDQPVIGDASVTATVTSTNVNLSQSTNINADFTESIGPDTENVAAGTYDADTDSLTFETTSTDVPDTTVAAGTYTAKALVDATAVSNTSTRTVSATTVDTVTADVAAGADNEALAANDVDARSGSGTLTLEYTVEDNAGDPIEDKTVTLTLKENAINSLAAAASVKVGSKTLTNSSAASVQSITATAVTDEDGYVSFDVSWTGAVAANVLSAEAKVDGVSSGADTITFEDAAAGTLHNLNVSNATDNIYFTKTSAFTLKYAVLDQFGVLFTAANHAVSVSDGAVTNTGTLVSGYADVAFAAYNADGDKDMAATVYKNNAATAVTNDIDVTIGAPKDVATIVLAAGAGDSFGTAAAPEDLMLKTWSNADTRLGQTAPTVANANTAEATLTDSNGNATTGTVTFSGEGLYFMKDSKVYTTGSITVVSTPAGVASVEIYSNTAGVKTLKVTSGSVSTTKSVYFATAKDDTGSTLTLTAPAKAGPGSTYKVTLSLKDKYGNAVTTDTAASNWNNGTTAPALKIVYTGPGVVVGSLPTVTDNSGEASFSVLLGTNDTGSATVTASYDANTATAAVTVSQTATIAVAGPEVVAKIGSFSGRVAVRVENAKSSDVSVKVGKKWYKFVAKNANYLWSVKSRKGTKVAVSVYVDGELQNVQTITVK